MNNRIKEIRKQAKLSQEKFGNAIGVSRDTIANIEADRIEIKEIFITSICREFNVNEEWLRTGQGEMYNLASNKLETYLGQISRGNDDFIKDIIEIYMELDQPSKDALKEISLRMAIKVKEREGK